VLCGLDAPRVLTDLSTLIGSYVESTLPLASFLLPELEFLHEVGSGYVGAMNVTNYFERNLEVAPFVRHDTQMGCRVIE